PAAASKALRATASPPREPSIAGFSSADTLAVIAFLSLGLQPRTTTALARPIVDRRGRNSISSLLRPRVSTSEPSSLGGWNFSVLSSTRTRTPDVGRAVAGTPSRSGCAVARKGASPWCPQPPPRAWPPRPLFSRSHCPLYPRRYGFSDRAAADARGRGRAP